MIQHIEFDLKIQSYSNYDVTYKLNSQFYFRLLLVLALWRYFHEFETHVGNIYFRYMYIFHIISSDSKVTARKLMTGDMGNKFEDHNAINTFCGGKSSMELEQSAQNICITVKGV